MQKTAQEVFVPHLKRRERILWLGHPNTWKQVTYFGQLQNALWGLVALIPWLGFSLYLLILMVRDFGLFIHSVFGNFMDTLYILSTPVWLFIGFLLILPLLKTYSTSRRTQIALTNQRMLIICGEELEIYPLVLIGELATKVRRDRIEARGGWGVKQIEFDGNSLILPQNFWYVEDIELVKNLLLNLFEKKAGLSSEFSSPQEKEVSANGCDRIEPMITENSVYGG